MTPSLIAAFGWLILANVLAMLPSKDNHWTRAYVLIGLGAPLLVWLVWETGWIAGGVFVIAAMSVLRWPLRYLLRWLRGLFGARG